RYLTTRDERQAARSIWTNGLLALPTGLLFFALGTALWAFYTNRPDLATPVGNDQIVPWFAVTQLPPGVAGLLVAGIFAAAMSSLDSSMNSVASAYVNDFYLRLIRGASQARAMHIAKWVTILMGAVGTGTAAVMAAVDVKSLFDYFTQMMGLLGGGLAGVFALAVFTRRAN